MIIYYGDGGNQLIVEPQPVLSYFKDITGIESIKRCPSVTDFFKNTFAICPTFDYDISYSKDKKEIFSSDYSIDFLKTVVHVRDLDNGVFSYLDPNIFFVPDCDSLEIEQLPLAYPFDVSNYTLIPGSFDIGKHTRPFEMAVKVNGNTELNFRRDKPIYLLRFKTEEKIQLKRFKVTKDFTDLMQASVNIRDMVKQRKPLNFFYNLSVRYKLKKQYLKLAKQNVID